MTTELEAGIPHLPASSLLMNRPAEMKTMG